MTNQEFFAETMVAEMPRFRNVIAALPDGPLDHRPDPRSRSARELVGHLIGHVQDLIELVDEGVIHHRMQVPFDDKPHALALFDESYATLTSRLSNLSDETWARPADFFAGSHLVMNAPAQALAWMLLLDSVHHRGQLSTYIRPMGGKVPAIYGPSADQPMAH